VQKRGSMKQMMEEYGESLINYVIGTTMGAMLTTLLIVVSVY